MENIYGIGHNNYFKYIFSTLLCNYFKFSSYIYSHFKIKTLYLLCIYNMSLIIKRKKFKILIFEALNIVKNLNNKIFKL